MGNKRRTSKQSKQNQVICPRCDLTIDDDDGDSIQCDKCLRWLHSMCSGLNKKQYREALQQVDKEYLCQVCSCAASGAADAPETSTPSGNINISTSQFQTIMNQLSLLETLVKDVVTAKKDVEKLNKDNTQLRAELSEVKSTLKFLAEDRVKNYVILRGLEDTSNSKTASELVIDLLTQLKVSVSGKDIAQAYFFGSRASRAGAAPSALKSVVVKFHTHDAKMVLLAAKKEIKRDPVLKMKLFINDFLTRDTLKLFGHAKSLKSMGYQYVYTRGNVIFAKRAGDSRAERINTYRCVDDLLLAATTRPNHSFHNADVNQIANNDLRENSFSLTAN